MKKVAPGCYFEPAEDEVEDPVVGVRKGSITFEDPHYRRHSILDDVPDDFAARMMGFKPADRKDKNVDVKTPDGFAVSIAYNKSGYQVIPKEDLKT